jgi:two-component system response regulator YesN
MIRTLIVEDEPPILRSVVKTISDISKSFDIIATCYNGAEALKIISCSDIDVLFTDIKMPVMDGIELIKYVRENNPHILIVIITGYSDFSYAKKAIQMDVFDYVLKPIDLDEFENVLLNVERNFDKEKDHLQTLYLQSLVDSEMDCMISSNIMKGYKYLSCLVLLVNTYPLHPFDYYLPAHEMWRYIVWPHVLVHKKDEIYSKYWVISGKCCVEKFIFLAHHEDISSPISFVNHFTQQFTDHIPLEFRQECFNIAFKTFETGDLKLVSHIKELRKQLNTNVSVGRQDIILNDQCEHYLSTKLACNILIDSESFANCIYHQNFEAFFVQLKRLLDRCEEKKITRIALQALLNQLSFVVMQNISTESYDYETLESDVDEAITLANNYLQLYLNLNTVYQNLVDRVIRSDLSGDINLQFMQKIKSYIEANYFRQISGQMLSATFGIDASYLSKQFKKYLGISPWKYMMNLKINEAKNLLKNNPHILLKDIASYIGFEDPLYFSRVFKKEVGVYPSKYKESIDSESQVF